MNTTGERQLPDEMTQANTCCFTGHRNLPPNGTDMIREKLRHAVTLLYASGFRYFVCGGALGFDMLAEEVLVEMKQNMPDLSLVLALPCRDQTGKWLKTGRNGTELLRNYMRLKAEAEAIVYVNDFYTDGCMRERNRFMVDVSSFCVAYYNGSQRSGAGQTYRMAKKANLKIYNIFDVLENQDQK